jgi:type I restriction enzyme S subunit
MSGEWTLEPLEKLIEPGRSISYGIVQPGSSVDNGVPIVRVTDVRNGRIATTAPLRVSPEIEAGFSRTRLRGGELILTLVGTVGEAAVVPASLAGWNTARAVAVIPVRADVGSYWVKLALRAPSVRHIIDSRLNTTVQATLNLRDVAQLPISLPPEPVRAAIAHILGTLDDKIELNLRMNGTLEAMAQALFQSWFVNFDPVRAKAEGRDPGLPQHLADLFPDSFEDSELGEIPMGWEVMELGMVSTFLNGYAFRSSDWQEHGVPVVKIGSVKPGFVDVANVSFVSEQIAASKDRYQLTPGNILIGMTGYVGEVGLVPISESPPLLNQRVGKVAPMSDGCVSRSFLYNWMRTSTFKDSVKALSHGSAQANVSSESIQSIPHAIPPSKIERAFASICEPILDRLLQGHREEKILANIRDTLLPRLISGELRIPDAERFLERVTA